MNDRLAKEVIKDLIQTHLEDPMRQWKDTPRNWVHTDTPIVSATFPRIEVIKRGRTNNNIISMGFKFWEQKEIILDIAFWTKVGFKWKNDDDVYFKDEKLVEEYLGKIWTEAIKPYGEWLRDTYKIIGLKNLGEAEGKYDEERQLFKGIVSVRIWYFDK